MLIEISKGDIIDMKALFKSLISIHYLRNDELSQNENYLKKRNID